MREGEEGERLIKGRKGCPGGKEKRVQNEVQGFGTGAGRRE